MPLARYALYAQNIDIYVAPTWDSGETWLATMQHIAREGGCWVVGCATALGSLSTSPKACRTADELFPNKDEWINAGDAVIYKPFGGAIAGPMHKKKGLLIAQIDVGAARASRRKFDASGHYARPDVFTLGARLDNKLAPLAHQVVIEMSRYGYSTSEALERGRDVDTVRGFFASPAPTALFDLPWMPLFLAFAYLLHPWLGLLTFAGALVLCSLTVVTEILTRRASREMHRAAVERNALTDSHARNADILKAMGFGASAVSRFEKANARHLEIQTRTSDVSGTFSGVAKVLRMMLQSALLGLVHS